MCIKGAGRSLAPHLGTDGHSVEQHVRFNIGFGVGPLRVSQRIGLPRTARRRPAQRERDYRERQRIKAEWDGEGNPLVLAVGSVVACALAYGAWVNGYTLWLVVPFGIFAGVSALVFPYSLWAALTDEPPYAMYQGYRVLVRYPARDGKVWIQWRDVDAPASLARRDTHVAIGDLHPYDREAKQAYRGKEERAEARRREQDRRNREDARALARQLAGRGVYRSQPQPDPRPQPRYALMAEERVEILNVDKWGVATVRRSDGSRYFIRATKLESVTEPGPTQQEG